MNLVIPTYRRLTNQLTWNTLHPNLRKFVTFIVRPDEADYFRANYAQSNVIETPLHVHDFSTTLQFLFDAFSTKKFIYMDDDLTGFFRRRWFFEDEVMLEGHRWSKHRLGTAEEQLELFNALLSDLELPYVGSVSCRPSYLPPEGKRYKSAQANIQLVAVDGALVKKIGARWDRLTWGSDLDFNLQLNNAGYDTLQRCDYSFTEPGVYNGEGGSNALLSRELRIANTTEMFNQLAWLWPQVYKKWSTPRKTMNPAYPKPEYRAARLSFLARRRKELGINL